MQVSLEYLYHFRCDRCQKWWTRADNEPAINEITFCPYCGHENVVEGIQTFLNAAQSSIQNLDKKSCLEIQPDSSDA